jgi:arsenite methyltransferase
VINLSPAKERVFQEAFRALKPGGRLMVSDIVLRKDLPEQIRNSISAYTACIAGATRKEKYLDAIRAAGFQEVQVLQETVFPVEMAASDPAVMEIVKTLGSHEKIQELAGSVVSVKVFARKPVPAGQQAMNG